MSEAPLGESGRPTAGGGLVEGLAGAGATARSGAQPQPQPPADGGGETYPDAGMPPAGPSTTGSSARLDDSPARHQYRTPYHQQQPHQRGRYHRRLSTGRDQGAGSAASPLAVAPVGEVPAATGMSRAGRPGPVPGLGAGSALPGRGRSAYGHRPLPASQQQQQLVHRAAHSQARAGREARPLPSSVVRARGGGQQQLQHPRSGAGGPSRGSQGSEGPAPAPTQAQPPPPPPHPLGHLFYHPHRHRLPRLQLKRLTMQHCEVRDGWSSLHQLLSLSFS
jgi:hypothetical protein